MNAGGVPWLLVAAAACLIAAHWDTRAVRALAVLLAAAVVAGVIA